MTTATPKTLAEMTTEELTGLINRLDATIREQSRRMGRSDYLGAAYNQIRQSCDETYRFRQRADNELARRGA